MVFGTMNRGSNPRPEAMDNEYMRSYMRRYSSSRREKVIEILGGKCETCDATDDLDVHHKDPREKEFSLGKRWHRAWDKIEAELPKCVLLCEDCHHNRHKSQ